MLIRRGTRLLDAVAVRRVHSGQSRRLRPVVKTVVLFGLLVGTGWLLIDGTRGANIANVLGLLVAVLSLLMTARTVLDGKSSTESSPGTGIAPGKLSGTTVGRIGATVVALTVVCGLLFTI